MEAESVWLADTDGRVTPGHALAVDGETGFGLVQALGPLDCPALELGRSSEPRLGDPVTVAAGAGTKPVTRDDRRQAGVRRLLGIFPRRGDLHLARPSVLGRRRRDRRGGQADRHRLAACRAAEREDRPARHQHDRADRPSAADPRRSPGLWPGQQAAAPVARRLFGRKRRRDHRRQRRRTRAGGRRASAAATFSPASADRRSRTSAISTARSGAAGRRGSRSRSRSSATAGRWACACARPTARPS